MLAAVVVMHEEHGRLLRLTNVREMSGERKNQTQTDLVGSLRQIISLMRQPRRGPLSVVSGL
jgi:hypothetical protein